MAKNKDVSQADQHWENRTLCSDENCIGVIGPDGRCKECGKKFEGDFSKVSVTAEEAVPPDDTELEETADASAKTAEPTNGDSPPDSDWESRTLCSDESCIGVIGPDGCCKECGKPFEKG
jgi:hypothetical protein